MTLYQVLGQCLYWAITRIKMVCIDYLLAFMFSVPVTTIYSVYPCERADKIESCNIHAYITIFTRASQALQVKIM